MVSVSELNDDESKILSIYNNNSRYHSEKKSYKIKSDNLNGSNKDIDYYNSLDKPLKRQLIKLQKILIEDKDIHKIFRKYFPYANSEYTNNPELFRLAILYCIPSIYFFEKQWFKYVYCYDNSGHKIYPKKIISVNKHTYVLIGQGQKKYNQDFIIKWYQSGKRNILIEIEMYQRLQNLDCPVPYFASKFYFWDEPVLIMEKLNQLDKNDDEYTVAISILEQLEYLHTFGVHNDIKPQNIMKRLTGDHPIYFLIDHGGLTTEKLKYGFRRRIWSAKFTSQKPHGSNQLTTAKNDLLELGYTMKYLQIKNKPHLNISQDIKSDFKGKLKNYMKRISKINKEQINKNDYSDLIDILQS